ncbi:hypothetical protein D3C75_754940 [compost metagenome]
MGGLFIDEHNTALTDAHFTVLHFYGACPLVDVNHFYIVVDMHRHIRVRNTL